MIKIAKWTQALSGLIALGVLTGCGGLKKPPTTPEAKKAVELYIWEDYISDEVVSNFTAKTGIAVNINTFAELDELMQYVVHDTDKIDVAVIDNSMVQQFQDLRLLAELDKTKLSNLSNIAPKYLNKKYDPENKYSIPYTVGTMVLAYRKDKISVKPDSWNALWNEAYKGKIYMFSSEECFNTAALAIGVDLNSSADEDLLKMRDHLMKQVPLVGKYTDYAEALEALESGDCWISPMYSGDASLAAAENENLGVVHPKEGTLIWVDLMAISRDAPNPDGAHKFIQYLMEPEVAGKNSSFIWYATPNKNAREFVEPELLNDPIAYPTPEVLSKCIFPNKPLTPAQIAIYNETWAQIKKIRDTDIK